MATLIPHPKLAKLLGTQTFHSDAPTVRALLDQLKSKVNNTDHWNNAKRATILVNGRNVHFLEGLDTPLGPDDKVWMVLPAGGG